DVGTGTARIPIRLCQSVQNASCFAIDLADGMLGLAKEHVAEAKLEARICLERRDAKATNYTNGSFFAVISNSIVHHIPEPSVALAEMWRLTKDVLFVRDLFRPESEDAVTRLVGEHAKALPEAVADRERHARQAASYEASLRAALTLDEVRAMA